MPGPSQRALEVAREETKALVDAGAEAVFLTGSHARGDAHPESDLDLRAIGEGSSPPLKRHDEFLFSTSWSSRDEQEKTFDDPSEAGEVVPGWRSAVILHDPDDVAAAYKKRAEEWEWDGIDDAADEWVAEQVTDYAEEVHTLVSNLDQDSREAAAAIASQLALHVAKFLSVHHRLLYESENDLWEMVAGVMGDEYSHDQDLALGVEKVTLEEAADAALRLFGMAAAETAHLLNDTQREVVEHACRLAGHPLPTPTA
jgi:predicted nucleotidyltransferase